jgi:succinyl-CoA synthetase alpha subunit
MTRAEKFIPNLYRDSVALMEVSARIAQLPGVTGATVVMATEANIALLAEAGFLNAQLSARPNDILIVIEGVDELSIATALSAAERVLKNGNAPSSPAGAFTSLPPTSLQMALEDNPQANLALISTPGEFAVAEAEKALRFGLHVMLFSTDIALEDEMSLKRMARDRGLLVMGPDCGTAIINGVPLGFANVVQRGPIGLVASSGTGLQQVTSLIASAGLGISQALGCGGRDLDERIGARSMLDGLHILAGDASTKIIVLIAKHPARKIADIVIEAARTSGKAAVVNFLGHEIKSKREENTFFAETLEDAAHLAILLARGSHDFDIEKMKSDSRSTFGPEKVARLGSRQKYIRGLFSGGTFCYESQILLDKQIGAVWSNAPFDPGRTLSDPWHSREHTLIDMGADAFTRGRPHPMIDLRLRIDRLRRESRDPETAVIFFDVVLGYGAHPNPAAEFAAAIALARRDQPVDRSAIFIASLCGTKGDPQSLERQESILKEAGVIVAGSNAAATRLAANVILQHQNWTSSNE